MVIRDIFYEFILIILILNTDLGLSLLEDAEYYERTYVVINVMQVVH